ncbi:unnamed protein product, partial [Vitis vinifera]
MFGLSRQLVKEALAMIRSQIPFGRKSMLETYGDIVFQAWKHVEGESRNEIENGFLQGLIEGAIHANSGALAASIRRVLGGFINQRTTNGVEKLLFRLTEPVIFRSLQVANSNVRLNSLHLLLDSFPLEDPDATKETKDTMLDKQFFLLERLLSDDCPEIRVVAVEGSCRILHLFWEIIPSSTITKMITKIFDDMSSDKCNEVRLSTLNGIMYLLGNPQSHEILKVLLPRLGHLILDPALSVRVAIADLLLLLRDIRTFQFHKVVGLDVLLSTLADDQPPVAQKITKLLIPSYFPSKVTPEEACKRCVTLIKRSPKAGARLCEFALSEGASMKSLLELVKVFISLVLSPKKLQGDQIESLLVGAAYLCNNLVTEPLYITALKELFSGGKLKRLFTAAETGPAQSSNAWAYQHCALFELLFLALFLQTVLEQTMYHLFSCIEKLFQAGDAGKSSKLPSERKKDHKKAANSSTWAHTFSSQLLLPCAIPYPNDIEFSISCSMHFFNLSQENVTLRPIFYSLKGLGTTFSEPKRISNVMKMLTAVLKFIVDAATMRLVSNDGRFLKFTTIYIQYTISIIRQHSQDQLQFNDDDLRGTFLCLKSSLTYTAKFLNLVLANTNEASTPPPEAYNLANYLLDLIISVESYLGSVYAVRLVTALKPWLPDLVLALGARHIMKQTSEEGTQFTESEQSELQLPSWTSILAKIELDELANISPNEEAERVSEPGKLSSFKKLIGMMTLLLRGNSSILDAVGKIFMTASAVALEREDFGLLLGLIHFVCVKLVGHEHRGWEGLDMMLASLEGIYPEIERQVEEPSGNEHGKQKLQKARALLEPIWINYTCESEGPSMMEE